MVPSAAGGVGRKSMDRYGAIVTQVIREKLRRTNESVDDNESFAGDLAAIEPHLYGSDGITDRSLNALWNYADSYFDARCHGFPDLDGLPWDESLSRLSRAVEQVEKGQEVSDSRILAYTRL